VKHQNRDGKEVGRGFGDLKAWQPARRVMLECHRLAETLPAVERFDLALQVRRSSKSTPANIAEGYGRYHYLDSVRFYYIARSSLNETINHVVTAHDLGCINDERFGEPYNLSREAERALNGYIAYVWKQRQGHAVYGERLVSEDATSYNLPFSDLEDNSGESPSA
jgi:four helix bundle protein